MRKGGAAYVIHYTEAAEIPAAREKGKEGEMKEIVLVAPIDDIYRKAQNLIREKKYDNVDAVLGNLEEGVDAAREAVAQGASLIISRGGTYQLIRKAVDVPVVEIRVSLYDIVESLIGVERDTGTIGIVGYSNVVESSEVLQKLLPMKIEKVTIRETDDIPEVLQAYKKRGVHTFIGDGTLTTIAEKQGSETILITSREESIDAAIQEARRILQANWLEKKRTERIRTIIDFMRDGLIAIDEEGKVILFNQAAEEIFRVKKEEVLGRQIQDSISVCKLPNLLHSNRPQYGHLLNAGDTKLVIDRNPVLVDDRLGGAVATFQAVDDFQKMEHKIRRQLADRGLHASYRLSDIIYRSEAMRRCIFHAERYAIYDAPTLVLGESGVGKELICQGMHNASARRREPFVAVNCAALAPSLMESELFGYAEGSFTGATRSGKAGIFELAHHGTVFLDEISELPFELQGKLLRVLQEHQVMRIGDDKIIPVDVKVICASNRNLSQMVREGTFRKDLFFRINILSLIVPPLRSRREDILPLAEHFMERFSKKYGLTRLTFDERTAERLLNRAYEGNVRELSALIERCVILSSFDPLTEEPAEMEALEAAHFGGIAQSGEPYADLQSAVGRYIREVFDSTGQNVARTCEILAISRSTLWRKRQELGF